jgi:hypothetical protein
VASFKLTSHPTRFGSLSVTALPARAELEVPVGAFADPKFPSPTFSVYEERMHGWIAMPADIERMA